MVATPGAAMTQSLVLLTREYTRLLLAQGKAGAVLDVMTRLEPQLRAEPDMWAVRANAAQRLGRHQDSVHAYLTALQSRPNEQRWLLGAAVSTAALGQTANATDLATRARAIGPISADVQTYLRQMGVNVKD
jgi:tetratricopeptide (TPR) repeat protein